MQVFPFLNDAIDGSTIFLLVMLCFLGAKLVERDAKLQVLGKRMALGAFFLFVAVTAIDRQPTGAEAWVAIILRSLIFAGIVLGAAWTILPTGAFVYAHTFGALFRSFEESSKAAGHRAEERKAERERRQHEAEWERQRPQREREASESATRAEADARVKAAAQKRREDARAACELAYALAAPEIAARFSKQDFTEFVTKYMTDKFPPESVEERAEQLNAIIRQHQEKVVPTPKFRSIQELAVWFEERKAEIEAVSDDRHRATLLVQLKERYSELTSQLLAEMTP